MNPLPTKARSAEDDGPIAFCERLICLYTEETGPGWWHEFEQPEKLLFADGGRIIEAPATEAREAAAKATQEGFRPVLLVPGVADWPAIFDSLLEYRAFSGMLVYGRDDRAIGALLHEPSSEIDEAVRKGGQLAVPNLAYGQALDIYFPPALADFIGAEAPEESGTEATFEYFCRTNPFRRLSLTVSGDASQAKFHQFYMDAKERACISPIRAGADTLRFDDNGDFVLNPGQVPVLAIIGALGPALWQAQNLWRKLADRVREMLREPTTYLSALQQIFLITAPAYATARRQRAMRGAPKSLGAAAQPEADVLLAVDQCVEATNRKQGGVRCLVRWMTTAKPSGTPAITVYRDDRELDVAAEWSEDRTVLVLRALGNETALPGPGELSSLSLRWKWSNAANGKLELWLRLENRR